MVDSVVRKNVPAIVLCIQVQMFKVLPALSLIRVDKLRLPDRSDRSSRKRVP